jgi:hypothetical protein
MFCPEYGISKNAQNGDTVRIALHTRVRADRSAGGAAAALPVVWEL